MLLNCFLFGFISCINSHFVLVKVEENLFCLKFYYYTCNCKQKISTISQVPLLELLVIPLFPKVEYFFLNPLGSMIAWYLLLLMSLVSMITIETLGYYLTPETVPCLSSIPLLNMSFLYYAIPLLFGGIISGLSFIFGLEFVLSQAPCNMSGMLTGAFWLIRATNTPILVH